MKSTPTYIGIDFGGTTISGGLVSDSRIVEKHTVSTGNHRPAEDIFDTIAELVESLGRGEDIRGIGVGVPVPTGPEGNQLRDAVNIPSMEGFPLRSRLEDRFGLPVRLENDARCMALGEYMAGALKGSPDSACITLGTGLGCGIIVNGGVYRGAKFWGGEIWCIPYGNSGESFEDVTSIRGLKSLYLTVAGEDLDPSAIYTRCLDGDSKAKLAFDMFGERVGRVAATVFCMLDPGMIAVGGGLARAYDAFSGSMMKTVRSAAGDRAEGRIVRAELSDDAAIIGAASLFA